MTEKRIYMAGLNIGEGAKEARGARLDKLAKAVRVLSVPPVLVGLLLTALWIFSPSVFSGVWQPLVTLFGLAVVPALAYPLSMIPALRKGGRDAQRDLALKLTPIGYVISTVFCWISGGGSNLWLINLGYLFSIIVLLLLNKVFHLKASGHACAITGPLIYAVIFFGWGFAPVCALLYALIFWSSLRLERHTPRDLLLGTLTACCALGIAAIIVSLF